MTPLCASYAYCPMVPKIPSLHGSDSKPILRDYIEQQTGRSSMLSGKPKIFFVQGCRGSPRDKGSEPTPTRRTQADGDDSDRADIYVCCAAVSGDKSSYRARFLYRDKFLGSWFITELCKILCEFGTCYNLNEMQKDLNEKVHAPEPGLQVSGGEFEGQEMVHTTAILLQRYTET